MHTLSRLVLLGLVLLPRVVHAEEREPDYQQWVQLYGEWNLDNAVHGMRLALDVHARRANAPLLCEDERCISSPNTLLIMRPSIGFRVSNVLMLSFGYAWVPSYFDDGFVRAARNVSEHRIWEQYSGHFAFGRLDLGVRTRLEQRFRNRGPGTGDVAHRFRQLVRLAITLRPTKPYLLIASNELFVHLSDSDYLTKAGFDQNRAFVGFGYQATGDFRVELGYMNHYVRRYTDPHQVNHVFSANVIARFGFTEPVETVTDPSSEPVAEVLTPHL